MAYPFESVPIPPELDRRRTARLTEEQKQKIRQLRVDGWTYVRIASEFDISSTFAQRICKPEYAESQDQLHASRDYYDKEKQVVINKRSRQRRKALFDADKRQWKTGLLPTDTDAEADKMYSRISVELAVLKKESSDTD